MKDLLEYIVKSITGSENFEVLEQEEENRVILEIKSDKDLIGQIIGKGGKTIKAIRNIVRIRAVLEKKGVYISVTEK